MLLHKVLNTGTQTPVDRACLMPVNDLHPYKACNGE